MHQDLHVRIPTNLKGSFADACQASGLNMTSVIVMLIRKELSERVILSPMAQDHDPSLGFVLKQ